MQAILMTAVGGPEVLSLCDVAEPEIVRPTEIKVKLHAAGVNPIDTKVRRRGLFHPDALPAILGCDGAGEVVEAGDAVDRFKPGDNVWFCHGGLGREPGNYAEHTVLDQRWVDPMPNISYAEAAAAPLVLITAWGALFERGGLQADQTVLIHAGAGGVGHVAIQLAKLHGARVITTVGSTEKADFAKALGADHIINYRQEDVTAQVNALTGGKGCDLVFDTVGPPVFAESIPATAHFGRLITILDPGAMDWSEARMRNLLIGFELMLTPMLRDLHAERDKHVAILRQCASLLEQGRLRIHVGAQLPLKEAAKAHTMIETGHTQGKIVLLP